MQLSAPAKLKKSGKATVKGRVLPARAGVAVSADPQALPKVGYEQRLRTGADGRFSSAGPVRGEDRAPRQRRGHRLAGADSDDALQREARASAASAPAERRSSLRPVSPALPGRRPAAAHQRGQADLPRRSRGGRVTLRFKHASPRPLPGRLHPVRRPRRAIHIQDRSQHDEDPYLSTRRGRHLQCWLWPFPAPQRRIRASTRCTAKLRPDATATYPDAAGPDGPDAVRDRQRRLPARARARRNGVTSGGLINYKTMPGIVARTR